MSAEKALTGHPVFVKPAQDLASKLSTGVATSQRFGFVPSLAGTRVSVQSYLGGNPMAMRARRRIEGQNRHVSVYVELISSCGIEAQALLDRGCAILALIEAIQASGTNVDLYLVCSSDADVAMDWKPPNGDIYQVIHIDSTPLDLSTAAFALSHPSFPRNVMYMYARAYGSCGSWAKYARKNSRGPAEPEEASIFMRKHLGMLDTDIYIPGTRYGDELINGSDKTVWLQKRLSQAVGA